MANLAGLIAEAALQGGKTLSKKAKAEAKLLDRLDDPFADLGRLIGGGHVQPAGTVGREAPEPLANGRVAQRFPTAAGATEDPLTQNLLVNTDTLRQEPKLLAKIADLIKTYPNATREMKAMSDPNDVIDAFRDLLVENKLALHDMMPDKTRARTANWYSGANRISTERANEVGIDPVSAAGAYAAQSPQKDWEQNVYLGDAVLRTLHHDPRVTPEMADFARGNQSYQDTKGGVEGVAGNVGRRLSNLSPREQALVIRAWDEVHNKGNRGQLAYHRISPEGDYLDLAQNQGGSLSKPAWGNFGTIDKAARIAQSGGDMNTISPLLGDRHKVRDFHNNIVSPAESARFGDYTTDTHDIAGSNFSPMSSNTPQVIQGMSGPPKSAISGLRGLYPLYADAGRIAASQRGLAPYQMQSITWEAVRSLFPAEFKTAENMEKVNGIWQLASNGKISRPEARKRIIALTGGFNPPKWMIAALGLMGLANTEDRHSA